MNDKYFNTEDLIFYKDNNDNIFSCGYKINSSLIKNKILDKKNNLTDDYHFPSAITTIQDNIFNSLNTGDNILENNSDFINDLELDSNLGSNINDTIPVILNIESNVLNSNIKNRFKKMLETGAIEEVKEGFKKITLPIENKASFRAIGVKEIKRFIDNQVNFKDLENAVLIKTR